MMTSLRQLPSHISARPRLPHCRRIVPGVEKMPKYTLEYNHSTELRAYPFQSSVRSLCGPQVQPKQSELSDMNILKNTAVHHPTS